MVHRISVPDVNVAAIRRETGLSQGEFARSIGVAKGTLLNWEHGRRRPTGPAQVLLALIAKRLRWCGIYCDSLGPGNFLDILVPGIC